MKKTVLLKTEEDTMALGVELADCILPGDVLALTGNLGAGKTTLTKAVAAALGIKENIASPTFTIIAEYDQGRLPFYHFDVYRVNDEEELFEIGFQEYIDGKGVCVIEWADLIKEMLPSKTHWINLAYGEEENERICVIEW